MYLVWLSGIWQIIGAGSPGVASLVYAQVADVCPAEKRTTVFSFIVAIPLVTQLTFMPLGAVLSSIDPWIPMLCTSLLELIALSVAGFLVSETLPSSKATLQAAAVTVQSENEENRDDTLREQMVRKVVQWMKSHSRTLPVLICLFLFYFGQQSDGTLLLQYTSKQFGWSYGQVRPQIILMSYIRHPG